MQTHNAFQVLIRICSSNTFDPYCVGARQLSVTKKRIASNQTKESFEKNEATYSAQHQGTAFEFTVVLPLNQGSLRKKGRNLFSGPFFGYFFGQAKM